MYQSGEEQNMGGNSCLTTFRYKMMLLEYYFISFILFLTRCHNVLVFDEKPCNHDPDWNKHIALKESSGIVLWLHLLLMTGKCITALDFLYL